MIGTIVLIGLSVLLACYITYRVSKRFREYRSDISLLEDNLAAQKKYTETAIKNLQNENFEIVKELINKIESNKVPKVRNSKLI